MFSGPFSEGQKHNHEQLKEVSFEDDDLNALRILLKLLHLQHDNMPKSLTCKELLNLAIVVNKYDCVRVVKYSVKHWLQLARNASNEFEATCDLTTAAFILGQSDDFRQLTKQLVLTYTGAFTSLYDVEESILPAKTFRKSRLPRNHLASLLTRGR